MRVSVLLATLASFGPHWSIGQHGFLTGDRLLLGAGAGVQNEAEKAFWGKKAAALQHHGEQRSCLQDLPPSVSNFQTKPTLSNLPGDYPGLGSPLELVEENTGVGLRAFHPSMGKQVGRSIALKTVPLDSPELGEINEHWLQKVSHCVRPGKQPRGVPLAGKGINSDAANDRIRVSDDSYALCQISSQVSYNL